jgi:hypothetical protein
MEKKIVIMINEIKKERKTHYGFIRNRLAQMAKVEIKKETLIMLV